MMRTSLVVAGVVLLTIAMSAFLLVPNSSDDAEPLRLRFPNAGAVPRQLQSVVSIPAQDPRLKWVGRVKAVAKVHHGRASGHPIPSAFMEASSLEPRP